MEGNLLVELFDYFTNNFPYLFRLFLDHLLMSVYDVLFADIIAVLIRIFIDRNSKLPGFVITLENIIKTIPALAMLAILMLVMGLGTNTVIMTAFLYPFFPIIKN